MRALERQRLDRIHDTGATEETAAGQRTRDLLAACVPSPPLAATATPSAKSLEFPGPPAWGPGRARAGPAGISAARAEISALRRYRTLCTSGFMAA